MNEIIISCDRVDSPREFHRLLARELHFPEWYGGNLDALYDCLTQISSETKLRLVGFDGLGSFNRGFCQVFKDAAEDNPNLQVTFF